MSSWTTVGDLAPQDLKEARLETHHAVQLVSIAIGRALVAHRDDDSHTALTWLAEAGQWVGEEIPECGGWRAGLRPSDLTLTLGRESQPAERQLSLLGKTRDEGLAWLRAELAGRGRDASAVAFDFHYEMPPHAVADGAAFRAELAAGFEELGRYYANGAHLLGPASARHGNAKVLTWAHHFDIGMVLPQGGEREVGVGLSPGDHNYEEPYIYISAYPRPAEGTELPALPRGHWRPEGFFAAILTATELLEGDNAGQEERASEFLHAAVEGARSLMA